ncbi:podoplanin isoform X2 [Dunckerocampus dactyliophorus]|uniref:podoplanin isoform X2 n=1 Tax=Dunckerocampus dactyliophorus TaxID=161453 RepID=UPI002406ADD1|nr:podoplanin isoform X2 [Dunckerocampus dactyliophorus]
MNVQLLLLLAFCAFTHASPTALPTDHDILTTDSGADIILEATEASKDLDVVTGPPPTEPATAEEQVVTDAVTEAPSLQVTTNTEEEPAIETETPAPISTAPPEPLRTEPPAVETSVPTKPAEAEVFPQWTEAAEANKGDEVVVEDGAEELSSGQVVGIVIGALLAVIIVIAVVIAVVRRMGKYSP